MSTEIEDTPLTYKSYLQLDKLLTTQKLQSNDHHDEMLFIIVHQAYEIWFKQIIHELSTLKNALMNDQIYIVISILKRVRAILKTIVTHADILETMSPFAFYSFRNYLGTASGFQSLQFREIEFLLGMKNESKLKTYHPETEEYKKLHKRLTETSIWDEFLLFIKRNTKETFKDTESEPSSEIQELFLNIYTNHSIYTEIAELMLDMDEGLQEWRYRHVKIVERMIGSGTEGTGGSKGFEYLKNTITMSFCPELWKLRNFFYV